MSEDFLIWKLENFHDVDIGTLQKDIKAADGQDLIWRTVKTHLDTLERLFVIDDHPPNVCSSVRVKEAPKRHFGDPSLAATFLGVAAKSLPRNYRKRTVADTVRHFDHRIDFLLLAVIDNARACPTRDST